MRNLILLSALLCLSLGQVLAQVPKPPFKSSKFEQLGEDLPTPNNYRTGSGAPGHEYWQQQADYIIKVKLDDKKQTLTGTETITYYNNSPDELHYLWVQLDQNRYDKESNSPKTSSFELKEEPSFSFVRWTMAKASKGGYKISNVVDAKGKPLKYIINKTMLRIDLPEPLAAKGGKFTFSLDWFNNINEVRKAGSRGGYEYFPKDNNYLYEIAQWFPRMAVYDDVNGWQNKQFLGRGEFALTFGDYEVHITAPADHIVAATGELQNSKDVLTSEQMERLKQAEKSDTPVLIVSQEEAEKAEKKKTKKEKTWIYKAKNVRDFAWASSRKFIWDAMKVDINGNNVWAMSYYPKEGNPLWGQYSTNVVAHTLEVYSKYTIDYPYPVAISVHGPVFGMEYPMICFNGGRPNPDGTVPPRTRNAMVGVIIHEVGHNFFPMIINSDERQWTWMDEGLNTFCQYLTEVELLGKSWTKKDYPNGFPSRRGPAKNIVPYMKTDPGAIVPIMNNSESIPQFGNNAYGKPATALNILRETVMGKELFDHAFKTYSQRWAFKHPMPADFFRTMEDASAVDLDWFWRGWFYTTEACDISIESVSAYQMPDSPEFTVEAFAGKPLKVESSEDIINRLEAYGMNLNDAEKEMLSPGKYFYSVKFKNIGGLVMPLLVEMTYKDDSKEIFHIPAEIWRMNPEEIHKVFMTEKEVKKITLDPNLETADIDMDNNHFPPMKESSRFEKFKEDKDRN